METRQIGKLIFGIFLLLVAAGLVGFTIWCVADYCRTAPADYAAWLGVTTGVLSLLTGPIVVILMISAVAMAVKSKKRKVFLAISAVLLALAWASLPLSPVIASFTYELTSPHIKFSAERAESWGEGAIAEMDNMAATRGDGILLYADGANKDEAPSATDLTKKYYAEVTEADSDRTFTLCFDYDPKWSKLTVTLQCELKVPEGEELEESAFDAPLHYLNALTERTFTREEVMSTLQGRDGAFDQSWDSVSYMMRFDDRQTIEVWTGKSATAEQRYDCYNLTITAWPNADEA